MTQPASTTAPRSAGPATPRAFAVPSGKNIFSHGFSALAQATTLAAILLAAILLAAILLATTPTWAQQSPTPSPQPASTQPLGTPAPHPSPLANPTTPPAVLFLFELERRFAADVATGGGKAFATWFADDAVTLNNGQPAVLGRGNIAAAATWSPAVYQLSWTPEGGQMLPTNDAGYTWGHYEGRSRDRQGQPVVTTGRYITLWKRTPAGTWKVALDASANEPAEKGACCTLPKP